MKPILDAACGGRMFWFDKQNDLVTFMDIRNENYELCDGRQFNVSPDIIGDFRDMPFDDDSFYMVVFDPPHLLRAGAVSWLNKKYGTLDSETWQQDIKQGFDECMRVLKPYGSLIFKWNEDQVSLSQVLKVIGEKPLFGDKRRKTHWMVFMKIDVD